MIIKLKNPIDMVFIKPDTIEITFSSFSLGARPTMIINFYENGVKTLNNTIFDHPNSPFMKLPVGHAVPVPEQMIPLVTGDPDLFASTLLSSLGLERA